ncbi:MAG: NAD(P)H-dependent glycerol-3-phosphate dehydrogenase [Planctomycetota bacterium]|jgi:glycerol-3-phosphate dehydrogenase (NAD(P)+)
MGERVAIVGDGQMGLVLAHVLAGQGVAARLWGFFPEEIEELARTRRSPRRLPGFILDDAIEVTADDAAVFEGSTLILNAVPTQFIRSVWERLRPHAPPTVPAISVSKGIEIKTLLRPTQVIADATGDDPAQPRRPMCALIGPTIAAELVRELPATVVAASADESVARRVQEMFTVSWLRIYRHDDVVGVEIAGAAKNVIALAAGMIDGLEVGYNAKSALLARGLAEIARLGAALGAKVDTFFGVAGVGDLATTCFCPEGRNRTCGERLGRGESLEEILATTPSVVEGVPTTRSVMELARAHQVDMPITVAVHDILFSGLTPRKAISALMQRQLKAETIG